MIEVLRLKLETVEPHFESPEGPFCDVNGNATPAKSETFCCVQAILKAFVCLTLHGCSTDEMLLSTSNSAEFITNQ